MTERKGDDQGQVLTRSRTKKPRKFKVLIHNDDYTSMEFVVFILQNLFKHTPASATRLMLAIHRCGLGVAGIYSREIAETRVEQALALAREAGHPLQCTMEPE
jgi:ATP-dependent Clp protease adaptor protein ClpS